MVAYTMEHGIHYHDTAWEYHRDSPSRSGASFCTATRGTAFIWHVQLALPCTACRYCQSYCPQALDIPSLMELYNQHRFTGGGFLAPMARMALSGEKRPGARIGCRSCEQVRAQQIRISEALTNFVNRARQSSCFSCFNYLAAVY